MGEENIFLDKIKLSFIVLKKETDLIEVYASLLKKINKGYIKVEEVSEWNHYHASWSISFELYSFLKNNKVLEVVKKKKMTKEEIKEFEDIMDRYKQPESEINFKELQKVVEVLQKIISLSGYHDDKFEDERKTLDEEEY